MSRSYRPADRLAAPFVGRAPRLVAIAVARRLLVAHHHAVDAARRGAGLQAHLPVGTVGAEEAQVDAGIAGRFDVLAHLP